MFECFAISSRRGWVTLFFLAAANLIAGCGPHAQDTSRPNVVIISLDTTRAANLGFSGYDLPTSPNLDRLAAESIHFERAYSVSTWTAPAHATLFTGLYPTEHGCHGDYFATDETTLPVRDNVEWLVEVLSERGYETLGVTAGPYLDRAFGFDRGFDRYDDELPDIGLRTAIQVNEIAIPWIRSRVRRGQPFFAFLNYFDPHGPYEPDPQIEYPFGSPNPASSEYHSFSPGTAKRTGEMPTLDDAETIIELYDQEIYSMDQQLDRLIESLRGSEVWKNTIVIAVGDHGEAFGDRIDATEIWGHGTFPLESVTRVPLLIKTLEGSPSHVPEPVSTVHLTRTISELAGCEEGLFPGINLCEAAQRRNAEPVFSERYFPGYWVSAIWDGRFKLFRELHADHDEPIDSISDIEALPSEKIFRVSRRESRGGGGNNQSRCRTRLRDRGSTPVAI